MTWSNFKGAKRLGANWQGGETTYIRCDWRSNWSKTVQWTRNRFVEKNSLLRRSRWIYTLLELLRYCEPCLEGFRTVIIQKGLIDFLQVIMKSSSLPKLCNTRFTYIGRSTMNNKLKRTDFFENFKLSTTLNEIFVVVVHDRWKTQHIITHALVDMFWSVNGKPRWIYPA